MRLFHFRLISIFTDGFPDHSIDPELSFPEVSLFLRCFNHEMYFSYKKPMLAYLQLNEIRTRQVLKFKKNDKMEEILTEETTLKQRKYCFQSLAQAQQFWG